MNVANEVTPYEALSEYAARPGARIVFLTGASS